MVVSQSENTDKVTPAPIPGQAVQSARCITLAPALEVIDGYEVARRIRLMPAGNAMLLAALTGFGQQSDRERARTARFDYHLVKPVSLEALGTVLDTITRPMAS